MWLLHSKVQFRIPSLTSWMTVGKYLFSGPASPCKWGTVLHLFYCRSPRPFLKFLRCVLSAFLGIPNRYSPGSPTSVLFHLGCHGIVKVTPSCSGPALTG